MRGRSRKPVPPAPRGAAAGTPPFRGVLELDRFTEESLERWSELSADLDELQDILYFNLEPERRRLRPELLRALQTVPPEPRTLESWVRIVDYRWSLHPLSAAGSLTSIGGRFNAGTEIDGCTFAPWPSLYLASDHATAYREKFQIEAGQTVDGLSPEELALGPGQSHTTVVLRGCLSRVFDLSPETLGPVAQVLSKIKKLRSVSTEPAAAQRSLIAPARVGEFALRSLWIVWRRDRSLRWRATCRRESRPVLMKPRQSSLQDGVNWVSNSLCPSACC